jgi:hypothetical protein
MCEIVYALRTANKSTGSRVYVRRENGYPAKVRICLRTMLKLGGDFAKSLPFFGLTTRLNMARRVQ